MAISNLHKSVKLFTLGAYCVKVVPAVGLVRANREKFVYVCLHEGVVAD